MARWTINAPSETGESGDLLASAKPAPSAAPRTRDVVPRYDGRLLAAQRRVAELEAELAAANAALNDFLLRAVERERQIDDLAAALERRERRTAPSPPTSRLRRVVRALRSLRERFR